MKKTALSLVAMFFAFSVSYAQWSTASNGTDIFNTNSGNIGIGTTTPLFLLHLRSAAPVINLTKSGILNWRLGNVTGNNFTITPDSYTGSGFNITSDGNVGIGTTTPATLFHIYSSGPLVRIESTTNNFYRGIEYAEGGVVYASEKFNANNGNFQFQSGTSGFGGFYTFNTDATEKMRIANNGNIGIGTTSPATKLHISTDANTSGAPDNSQFFITGATSTGKRLSFAYNTSSNYGEIQAQAFSGSYSPLNLNPNGGNVGIGTTSPTAQLTVQKDLAATQTLYVNRMANASLELVSTTSSAQVTLQSQPTSLSMLSFNHGTTNYANIYTNSNNSSLNINGVQGGPVTFSANSSEAMRILSSGNIAIGTTDTHGYKFAVNGSAIATSMTVQLYANWPDYVFKKGYVLPDLNQVKNYIDQYHHLPEMPTEQQVAKEGLNLGEMNKLLVKK